MNHTILKRDSGVLNLTDNQTRLGNLRSVKVSIGFNHGSVDGNRWPAAAEMDLEDIEERRTHGGFLKWGNPNSWMISWQRLRWMIIIVQTHKFWDTSIFPWKTEYIHQSPFGLFGSGG